MSGWSLGKRLMGWIQCEDDAGIYLQIYLFAMQPDAGVSGPREVPPHAGEQEVLHETPSGLFPNSLLAT